MPLITTVLTIALYALLVLVFVRAALSWFSPHPTSEWQRLVFRATEPMLAPVRRWVPPVSGPSHECPRTAAAADRVRAAA